MLFNALEFPVFLILVLMGYRFLKTRNQRQYLLLGASLFFYGYWEWTYLLLLLATSGIDFFVALKIGKASSKSGRKLWLMVSLLSNLSILGYFKYAGFFVRSVLGLPQNEMPGFLNVLLPVGISFYTFQAMGYVLDVYRNRLPPESHFSRFLLFITFFPQLVAGPIERAPHLLGQLNALKGLPDTQRIFSGLALMAMGFVRKLCIADRLAPFTDTVFNTPENFSLPVHILGLVFFGFQIYNDFAGYSDIARGVARLFGIELMENFRQPYLASGLGDFWRRWHISLSGWFRDYVYQPLGAGSHGSVRTAINLLVVFGLSGFWHGANWTFLIWGAWHGTGLILERFLIPALKWRFVVRPWTWIWVFGGWFFFRISDLSDISRFKQGVLTQPFRWTDFNLIGSWSELSLALISIPLLLVLENQWPTWKLKWEETAIRFKAVAIGSLAILILWIGTFKGQDFIYFQF
jgi:D-alanyl-lipoteichoic acid acyltransferase DltB (MBOAT superfamily)